MNISALKPEDIFLKASLQKGPMAMVKKGPIPVFDTENKSDEELIETCKQFESLFVNQLLKEMRKTVPKDGIIPQSQEEEMFTAMFDEEVSKMISSSGRMGMAEMLFEQLRDKSKDNKPEFHGENVDGAKYFKIDGNH